MSKIACYLSHSLFGDDMFFAIKFSDKDYERGKALALEGWNAWFGAEDDDEFWNLGYEEGATNLLNAAGIKYELIEGTDCPDENDGWPLWFNPNTITDWYEPGDKIKEVK